MPDSFPSPPGAHRQPANHYSHPAVPERPMEGPPDSHRDRESGPGFGAAEPDAPALNGADLARRALADARAAARERGAKPTPERRRKPRAARSRTDPQSFDGAVRAWLIEHGWQDQVAIGGVFGRWEQIVGERLAAHVRPERVEDGELVVVADSPSWATQVRALAPQLLRRLNGELGEGAVRSVRVRGPGGPRRKRFG